MEEAALVELVADVRTGRLPADVLVDLLAETSDVYAGRGANEVARRKSWILAAFEESGLPNQALPYVLEELDTAREPYVAAAAAMALRGATSWEPRFAAHLASGFSNMKEFDGAVSFAGFRPDWSNGDVTSALEEIVKTLVAKAPDPATSTVLRELLVFADDPAVNPTVRRRLRDAASVVEPAPAVRSCCDHPVHNAATLAHTAAIASTRGSGLSGIHGQDQDGHDVDLHAYLSGRVTVIGFFYTRCENPYKCPLTVIKLGEVCRRLTDRDDSGDVQVAAISYDSPHDIPARLARYARAYRFVPSERDRLIRITSGEERMRAHFALNVGYAGSLVNRHGLELYLTGPDCRIVRSWKRELWDVDDVVRHAMQIASPSSHEVSVPSNRGGLRNLG